MPDPDTPGASDDDVAAGELALGVLDGDERAAALRRVVAEPAFATRVDDWRARLAPLLDGIAEVPPPENAWPAIAAATSASAPARALARWRAAALVAMATAAALALVLVWPRQAPPTAPAVILVAQISDEAGDPLLVASYDASGGLLSVRTSNLPVGQLLPELWVIGSDATPRSLGHVALNDASRIVAPAALRGRLAAGSTFAVTLEPREGAPHAAPTGEILGTAKLAML